MNDNRDRDRAGTAVDPRQSPPRTSPALVRSTGRDRAEWFGILDRWGAAGRPYREIADWLTTEHGLSKWWAQKLIVEYEETRGVRAPGIRRDRTFEVGATRTIAVPVERAYAAFVDTALRDRWLPGATMHERTSVPGTSVGFDWNGGPSRIAVTLLGAGEGRTQVAVQHQRLRDAASADRMKAYWRERLAELKALLEG